MKKLLVILACLISYLTEAQTIQFLGSPTTQIYIRGQLRVDTVVYLPLTDTTFVPSQKGALVFKSSNNGLYLWNGLKWNLVPVGSTAWGSITGTISSQTDLIALLNGYQPLFTPAYGIKLASNILSWDSANVRKVDTMFRTNDSTLTYRINGVAHTVLIRGTPQGGINSLVLTVPADLYTNPVTFNNTSAAWTGTLALLNQSANSFWTGPTVGSPAVPSFRLMTTADLPSNIPNGNLANSSINLAFGSSGTSPGWALSSVSLGGTATFNIPNVSGTNTGVATPTQFAFWNAKVDSTIQSNDSVYEFRNGTRFFRYIIAAGGGGITSLNGLTAGTQTFAVGSAGTAPAFVSSGTIHTLNIPTAASSSVTLGGISHTDYSLFLAKEPAITASNTVNQYWNGYKQFVTLNTDSITEGSTNLFYTNARARTAISLATTGSSGAATYNSSTGAFNIPQYQAAGSYITSLTTDVVAAGPGAAVATIQPNAVTYSKIQPAAGQGLMGATGAGNYQNITLGTNLSMSGSVLNAANATVATQLSVQGDGSSGNKIQLVNDSTPGNDYYYGTSYIGRLQYSPANVNWKNAIKLGADPTGVIDATSIIQTAINAGFSVYFPNATYQIKELKLKDSSRLLGESTTRTIFKMTTADTCISMKNYCEVDHIYFKGNRTAGQIGINADSVLGCIIHDIRGDSMGTVIRTARAALIPGNLFPYGNSFYSIQGRSNKVGMRFDVRGEYSNVSNVNFNQCDTSLINISGNNSFVNFSGTLGSVGMYEGTDNQNDGHASCTNCKFNHNAFSLIVANSTAGYTFNASQFYFGKMQINNSSFIEFLGCDFKPDSLSFNTSNASFVGCKFLNTLLIGQVGSNLITTLNCSDTHGVNVYDILGNKNFYILNSGGSTLISNNVDKSMQTTWNGSMHMEYNASTVTDPFQFYVSGGTSGSFDILNYHLSPLYALRVDNAGNTGIHLTSPTAFLHIAGGTATAGTAPLKITSGTLLTTTEAGAIENNGSHLYYSAANGGTRFQLDQQATGVTTVGGFSGSSQTNGATISGSTITYGPADGTNPGMVSTGAQTIAGAKSFSNAIYLGGTYSAGFSAQLTMTGNVSVQDGSTSRGAWLNLISGNTVTDGSGGGTISGNSAAYLGGQTFAATAATTYTDAATLWVNGPPTSGTNVTITNPWAFRVNSGNSYFNGNVFGSNSSDINISHFIGNSGTPGIAGGAGAGTGPTVSITGTDQSGVISITTGTTPSASAAVATITYNYAYPNNSFPSLTPANAATALLSGVTMVYTSGSTTNFVINSGTTALTTLTTYSWYYNVGAK